MLTRAAIVVLFVLIFCFVGFPSHSKPKTAHSSLKKAPTPTRAQDPPLTVSTTKVTLPNGSGVAWNLTGRYQNAGRVVNLRVSTVKPSCQNCGINPGLTPASPNQAEQPPEPDERDTDYYYSNSDMTKSDGTVMVQTTYEFEYPANRDVIYFTVGGVTITLDLNTQEALPISDVDQQRLDAWGASEDASLCRDALAALIDQASGQPFEVLQNYYADALLLETGSASAAGPRLNNSGKTALHHAVTKLRDPNKLLSKPCFDGMIAPVNAVATRATAAPLMATVVPQCYGCCGPGCHCISDRYGAPIYGTPCANHDSCVSPPNHYYTLGCTGKLVKAILYTWYRNTYWGAHRFYQ